MTASKILKVLGGLAVLFVGFVLFFLSMIGVSDHGGFDASVLEAFIYPFACLLFGLYLILNPFAGKEKVKIILGVSSIFYAALIILMYSLLKK